MEIVILILCLLNLAVISGTATAVMMLIDDFKKLKADIKAQNAQLLLEMRLKRENNNGMNGKYR